MKAHLHPNSNYGTIKAQHNLVVQDVNSTQIPHKTDIQI